MGLGIWGSEYGNSGKEAGYGRGTAGSHKMAALALGWICLVSVSFAAA